jgi:hypothetical protein
LVIIKELPRTPATPPEQTRVWCLAANRAVWVVKVPLEGFRQNLGEVQKREPEGIEGIVVAFDDPRGAGLCMGAMEVTREQKRTLEELVRQAEIQGHVNYPLARTADDVIRHAILEMTLGKTMRPEGAIKLWEDLKREGKVRG